MEKARNSKYSVVLDSEGRISAAVMPWQNNLAGGVYLNGTAYPLQKRYEILQSFMNTGSISESARDNQICYLTTDKIVTTFLTTGSCEARKGGNELGRKLEDWMQAYLEALVLTEPWLYLREIRNRLTIDLNLQPNQVPRISSICMALANLELGRKKLSELPKNGLLLITCSA